MSVVETLTKKLARACVSFYGSIRYGRVIGTYRGIMLPHLADKAQVCPVHSFRSKLRARRVPMEQERLSVRFSWPVNVRYSTNRRIHGV